jgi:hypothetical protein
MLAPALLQELVLSRKPASAWVQSIIARAIDYAVIWIGSNIVKEKVRRLFCGDGDLGMAGGNGAESNK